MSLSLFISVYFCLILITSFLKCETFSSLRRLSSTPRQRQAYEWNVVSQYTDTGNFDEDSECIRTIIEGLRDHLKAEGDLSTINFNLFMNNTHILCKQRLYEKVMNGFLLECRNENQLSTLHTVEMFLSSFITTERRNRARMKFEYIIAGAVTKRLDEAISLLSNADEIDDDLIAYIDYLSTKSSPIEDLKASVLENDQHHHQQQQRFVETDESHKAEVLSLIRKRLEVELKLENNLNGGSYVRMLHELINEDNEEDQSQILKKYLKTLEDVEKFNQFLDEGIAYFSAIHDENLGFSENVSVLKRMKDIVHLILVESI